MHLFYNSCVHYKTTMKKKFKCYAQTTHELSINISVLPVMTSNRLTRLKTKSNQSVCNDITVCASFPHWQNLADSFEHIFAVVKHISPTKLCIIYVNFATNFKVIKEVSSFKIRIVHWWVEDFLKSLSQFNWKTILNWT